MTKLIRAEWRKVTTTRLWWGMLIGAMALAVLSVVSQIASNGTSGSRASPLSAAATQQQIAASAAGGALFAVVVGIILLTTEFRHFTSRPTFLLEPRRARVVVAKMIVGTVIGLGYGVACVAITVAIMVPWLGAKGVTIGWMSKGVLLSLVASVLVIAIYTVVGIGVGSMLRNQIAAVIGAVAYLFAIEPLISAIPFVNNIYRFLPEASANALTGGSRLSSTLLTPWEGGLLFLGWGLLFATFGGIELVRRDIP
jgi:ABC-2 type transport system permease protein